ncbi:hypothetical protein GR7B_00150 [Vibrio phage vB_VcorM_GR7B]|nr:hypothetical protein GR7B_00150 [Vibrio phage vB_VcorM_GR7B]
MANHIDFNSIDFLPKDLRDRPLYEKICSMIDYVTETNHYSSMEELLDHYQFGHTNYSSQKIINELGGTEIQTVLRDTGARFDDTSLPRFLSLLYSIKGTAPGIVGIMSLLGLRVTILDHYRVSREIALGTANGLEWAADPDLNGLQPCEMLLDIESTDFDAIQEGVEQKIQQLAEAFFWVCGNLVGIKVGLRFINTATITETLEVDFDEDFFMTYGVGHGSIPVNNQIGTFTIGAFTISGNTFTSPLNHVDEGYWDEFEMDDSFELSTRCPIDGYTETGAGPFLTIGGFTIGDGSLIEYPGVYPNSEMDTIEIEVEIMTSASNTDEFIVDEIEGSAEGVQTQVTTTSALELDYESDDSSAFYINSPDRGMDPLLIGDMTIGASILGFNERSVLDVTSEADVEEDDT